MKKHLLFTLGMTIFVGMLCMLTNRSYADIVIESGSTMKVSSGTSVVLTGDFTNDGTADLGEGSVVFNGTVTQTISGATVSEFGNLELDNSAGLDLAASAQVDGTLTLTDGILSIGANNLTFASSASAVAGTFSASRMILADGTGHVRKAFPDGTSNPASFFMPIGSDDGTAEYSPVDIDFNTSTFSSAYVGINVTPLIEPNNTSADNYLLRYWAIENVGITSYSYDLTATYVDGDITGTEADISGALYSSSGWMIGDPVNTGANTFLLDDFDDDGNGTGVEFRILSDLKIFLQGAYQSSTNEMTTVNNPNLPLTAAAAYAHIGYLGPEAVSAIPSIDIVDWILVEVRDATTPATATSATVVETVAGFLMKDGSIVGLDGVSPLPFKVLLSNNPYFVIVQRNHLSIMTASSPTESFGTFIWDFTDINNKAYGTNAQTQVDTSPVVFALFAGETNLSGVITHADKQEIDDNLNVTGYEVGDTNFSGVVTHADKQYIDDNLNETGQVPL